MILYIVYDGIEEGYDKIFISKTRAKEYCGDKNKTGLHYVEEETGD